MIDLSVVLALVGGATLAIAVLPSRKEPIALLAAAGILVFGQLRGFFPADRALQSISMPVILILLSIGVFAEVFSESGLFERLCRAFAIRVGGSRRALVLAFLALTFFLSAFLNNLTCLYVLLPLMIGAMQAVGMGPLPLRRTTVAIVIASNLGGASTMIGDFPNILIARSQSIPFLAFLGWMFPACLLLLGGLAVLARARDRSEPAPLERGLLVAMIRQQAAALPVDRRLLIPAVAMFGILIGGLILTSWWPFPPEVLALACAAVCIWALPRPQHWLTRVDVQSALFISCLFLFAGAIQATGALDLAARGVVQATQGSPYLLSAAVIGLACLLTAVFSAGPTTAALIPAAAAMKDQLPGHMIWWCLSLGVLAGSSATLLSATAGPVAVNIVKARTGVEVTFGDFLRLGWKAATLFALASTLYIWLRLSAGF